jgi:hypothetical protein
MQRGMKLALPFIILGSGAFAQGVTPTVELPAEVVVAVRHYLGSRPSDEVNAMVAAIQACVSVQVPDDKGVVADHGQCPVVSAAIQARKATSPTPAAK